MNFQHNFWNNNIQMCISNGLGICVLTSLFHAPCSMFLHVLDKLNGCMCKMCIVQCVPNNVIWIEGNKSRTNSAHTNRPVTVNMAVVILSLPYGKIIRANYWKVVIINVIISSELKLKLTFTATSFTREVLLLPGIWARIKLKIRKNAWIKVERNE